MKLIHTFMGLAGRPVFLLSALAVAPGLRAGDYYADDKAPMETEVESAVSGTLSFDYNTHFISYGADVWGAGSSWGDSLFNPSLELGFALPGDYSLTIGTWWDVNSNAVSSIGNKIQEIDIWTGISKDFGFIDAALTYQQWAYASDTEHIIDLALGFDLPLSPSFTVHGRPDAGASGGDEGAVFVLGAEHGFDLGPVAFTIPFGVAAATDGYHGGGSGYAYSTAGLQGSIPLGIPSEYGDWSLHAGVTFYHTSTSVIPNNPDESFVTGNIGVSCSF